MDQLKLYIMTHLVFCLALAILLLSYIVYPVFLFLLNWLLSFKTQTNTETIIKHKPGLALVCAAYNEETVIQKKLENILNLWDEGITEVWIGSDCSTDSTNNILEHWCNTHQQFHAVFYNQRQGKINIINDLVKRCQAPLILITDANIILPQNTVHRLIVSQVTHQSDLIGVSVHRKNTTAQVGIAAEEYRYMNFENTIKSWEFRCFGIFMGAEGSCLLIQKTAFTPVPSHFKVDDFFITMQMIRQAKRLRYENHIHVLEDNPGDVKGEFMRKSRIANGNFQNLIYFRDLFFNPFRITAYMFWLHKGIRWTGPIWLFLLLVGTVLKISALHMQILCIVQCSFISTAVLSYYKPISIPVIRSVAHFYLMNAAMVKGCIAFLKQDSKSYWNPIKRHV